MDGMTKSDVVKPPVKVTVEQAVKAMESDVNALLTKHFDAAELSADDLKSRKFMFRAFVALGAAYLKNAQAMDNQSGSLTRNAMKGVKLGCPYIPVAVEVDEGDTSGDGFDEDEG